MLSGGEQEWFQSATEKLRDTGGCYRVGVAGLLGVTGGHKADGYFFGGFLVVGGCFEELVEPESVGDGFFGGGLDGETDADEIAKTEGGAKPAFGFDPRPAKCGGVLMVKEGPIDVAKKSGLGELHIAVVI